MNRCMLCGRASPIELHHPTRRPAPGRPYFDPGLRIALCRGCHARIHEALRVLGLDLLPARQDPLTYRLRTVAVHAGVAADAGRAFVVADVVGSRGLRGLLLEAADALGAAGRMAEEVGR
ncbi:MAG: hypothetical protein ACRD0B_00470 [Acidimicrobiales bacterium]